MLNIFRGPRPDITPAQLAGFLIGGIPVLANLAHAFGVFSISKVEQDALKQAMEWAIVGGGVLVIGDAGLRSSRNHADATVKAAALHASGSPPDGAAAAAAVEAVGPPSETSSVDDIIQGADEHLPSDEEEFAAPPGGGEATVKPDAP